MKTTIIEKTSEKITVALQGELDTVAAQQFAKDMEPVMAEESKLILIDFSELDYISSAGMRIILFAQKTVRAKGGNVQIKGMSEDIKQIFQLTGFDQMIEIL